MKNYYNPLKLLAKWDAPAHVCDEKIIDALKCISCLENKAEYMFMCGHLTYCKDCCEKLQANNFNDHNNHIKPPINYADKFQCPICRKYSSIIKVFI
jgi:hypothetical protein